MTIGEAVVIAAPAVFVTIVAVAVPILRRRCCRDLKRPFAPVVPILAALACLYLMFNPDVSHLDPLRRLARARVADLGRLQPRPSRPAGRVTARS
jgi:amino acid transporter